ncbi:hypothetical protein HUT06_03460 [Actinomadura sp. NAK00032]|uniref:permease-like cell division protein FtsX n=1 Tax=Actinomadura sp. NAK00032 TaxID=2742128 RepID=UPI0015917B63|nr:permease-like cell division protein FtsX [Actinomadura sp. NAK00032]QKW33209.1 hypothetical protein HUT06_03460 [Actinomadura sp. NAK00032]
MSEPGERPPDAPPGDGGGHGSPPVPPRPSGAAARPGLVVAAAAAALLLLVGAGIGGWFMMRDDPAKDAAPAGQERDVAVFFCVVTSSNPTCGHQDAEQAEKDALKRRLQEMNGVLRIKYESKEQAYENFKKVFADRKDMLSGVSAGDIPDSFRLRVADIGAANAVKTKFDGTPGVDTIVIQPLGKA